MRDKRYSYLVEELGEPTLKQTVSTELIAKYRGVLPDLLLHYWETEGFNQFRHGLYCSVNPDEWQGVVNEWIAGTVFEPFGPFYAVTRTAFGEIYLFSHQVGTSVTIEPMVGEVKSLSLALKDPSKLWAALAVLFSPSSESWDTLDNNDKPLFDRALKKLGPLAWNEMYAFEPSLLLGGEPRLENLAKVDAYVHCSLLRQCIDKPWVPFTDIGEALGVDTAELARQAIERHKAK